jgi:malonyl CoA-acyl carrier protein transacylase
MTDGELLRKGLVTQVTSPVLWHQSVLQCVNDGYTTFVEMGTGSVLSSLITSNIKTLQSTSTSSSITAQSIETPSQLEALARELSSPPSPSSMS